MIASALAGPSVEGGVERGVVSLRVPERVKNAGHEEPAGRGNTLDLHDDG
jgi:hypothetical protein